MMPDGKEPQHFYLEHIEFDDMGELSSTGDSHPEPTAKPTNLRTGSRFMIDILHWMLGLGSNGSCEQ